MVQSLIVLSTFAAATLLVIAITQLVYDWVLRYRLEMRSRLNELSGDTSDGTVRLFRNLTTDRWSASRLKIGISERVANTFTQAGMKGTLPKLLTWCVGCGLASGAFGLIRGKWFGIAGLVAGFAFPLLVLYARRHFRQRALTRQLPEAFEMMSRAVRAGQTVPASLQIIAEDFEPPISEEFKLCYEQQDLGMSREAALQQLAQRSGVMELQIFVVALLVQARFGGDLAELLDNLAVMIRKRFKLADRVRALTGEGRMQAMVLTVLPIAALAGLLILAPDYISTLFSRPWLMAGTALAQIVGLVWIQRIVRFEV